MPTFKEIGLTKAAGFWQCSLPVLSAFGLQPVGKSCQRLWRHLDLPCSLIFFPSVHESPQLEVAESSVQSYLMIAHNIKRNGKKCARFRGMK